VIGEVKVKEGKTKSDLYFTLFFTGAYELGRAASILGSWVPAGEKVSQQDVFSSEG
jgi:hypothetical protein